MNQNRWVWGISLITLTAVLALLSLVYIPYDPNQMDLTIRLAGPSWSHWLGTDQYGRDLLSRIMVAARNAYSVGVGSVTIGLLIGGAIGSIAGYTNGWFGELAMRVIDGLYAFPHLLLALMIVAILGVGERNALIAIGMFNIPLFARLTFSSVLEIKQRGYVKAAQMLGATPGYILIHHILRVISPKLVVQSTSSFGLAILTEASLSFLGLGVQLPNASWGMMLEESRSFMLAAPWYPFIPGLAVLVTVLGVNLLGDGLHQGGGPVE
ncbi:MAG: ABC transporter permease [Desulfitobacteriaceae bacterium]